MWLWPRITCGSRGVAVALEQHARDRSRRNPRYQEPQGVGSSRLHFFCYDIGCIALQLGVAATGTHNFFSTVAASTCDVTAIVAWPQKHQQCLSETQHRFSIMYNEDGGYMTLMSVSSATTTMVASRHQQEAIQGDQMDHDNDMQMTLHRPSEAMARTQFPCIVRYMQHHTF
uniref:Uncharacterized protein n=1 Tax=Oryza sativa subsp. japonica TaxID=39947 RepID=Q5Z404_ORYSJ|nr:hypothetical protein [Oryza sativa Japonica Group]